MNELSDIRFLDRLAVADPKKKSAKRKKKQASIENSAEGRNDFEDEEDNISVDEFGNNRVAGARHDYEGEESD